MNAFPAEVAVHGKEPTDDRTDSADASRRKVFFQTSDELQARFGCCVSAVCDDVSDDLLPVHIVLLQEVDQGDGVIDVRVNSAVGQKSE